MNQAFNSWIQKRKTKYTQRKENKEAMVKIETKEKTHDGRL